MQLLVLKEPSTPSRQPQVQERVACHHNQYTVVLLGLEHSEISALSGLHREQDGHGSVCKAARLSFVLAKEPT